jgi:hypothetical protein
MKASWLLARHAAMIKDIYEQIFSMTKTKS